MPQQNIHVRRKIQATLGALVLLFSVASVPAPASALGFSNFSSFLSTIGNLFTSEQTGLCTPYMASHGGCSALLTLETPDACVDRCRDSTVAVHGQVSVYDGCVATCGTSAKVCPGRCDVRSQLCLDDQTSERTCAQEKTACVNACTPPRRVLLRFWNVERSVAPLRLFFSPPSAPPVVELHLPDEDVTDVSTTSSAPTPPPPATTPSGSGRTSLNGSGGTPTSPAGTSDDGGGGIIGDPCAGIVCGEGGTCERGYSPPICSCDMAHKLGADGKCHLLPADQLCGVCGTQPHRVCSYTPGASWGSTLCECEPGYTRSYDTYVDGYYACVPDKQNGCSGGSCGTCSPGYVFSGWSDSSGCYPVNSCISQGNAYCSSGPHQTCVPNGPDFDGTGDPHVKAYLGFTCGCEAGYVKSPTVANKEACAPMLNANILDMSWSDQDQNY